MCGVLNPLHPLNFHIILIVTNRRYLNISPLSTIHQSFDIIPAQGLAITHLPIRSFVFLLGTRSYWITTKGLSSYSPVQCGGWLCGWTLSALP